MPCYDERNELGWQLNNMIVAPAHLLCEACSLLEEAGLLFANDKVSKELIDWYKQHEEKEKKRVAYEAALKLNVRERRILGIDLQVLRKAAGK